MTLIDKIAVLLGGVREVQARLVKADNTDEATDLESYVIEPLETLALDIDELDNIAPKESRVAAKSRMPKSIRFKRTGGGLKWECCKEATKSRTRKGKAVWMAWCKWRKGNKTGGMVRVLGRGDRSRPKKVKLGNRIMKRC